MTRTTLGLIRNYFIFSFKAQVTSPGFLTFTFQRFFLIQFFLDRLEMRIIKVFKKSVSRTIHSSYQRNNRKKSFGERNKCYVIQSKIIVKFYVTRSKFSLASCISRSKSLSLYLIYHLKYVTQQNLSH